MKKILTILICMATVGYAGFCSAQDAIDITHELQSKDEIKSSCDELEKRIRALMDEANYCNVDSDCMVSIEFQCPFGCWQLFNKNADLTQIRKSLIEEYYKDCPICIYECAALPKSERVKCKDNKCIVIQSDK